MRRVVLPLVVSLLTFTAVVEAQTPAFTLSSNSLDFNANAGTSPGSQNVTLTNNTASPLAFTLTAITQSGGNWLSAGATPNPVPGRGSSTITISISSSKLAPGTYTGSVKVTAGTTTATITVTLTINGVSISVSPNSISIPSLQKGSQQSTAIHISGSANVQIAAATNQGAGWLSVDSGSVSSPGNFNVIVDASSLNAGNYSGTVTLQCVNGSPCIPVVIPVNVTVAAAPLTITTTSLPQANVGSSYSTTLAASGGAPPYTWSATGLPSGLAVSAAGVISGTPTVLGTFQPTVTVRDSAGASVSKTLSLSVVGVATLVVSPNIINFAAQAGQRSQTQPVHIQVNSNTARVKMDASYDKGSGWLSLTASPSSLDYSVAADASSLSAGTYTGTLTVSCTDQTCNPSAVPVRVTLTVSAASQTKLLVSPPSLDFQAFQGRSNAAPGKLSLTTDDGSSLAFNFTAPVWAQISSTSSTASANPANLTVTPNVNALSLGPNTGTITITPVNGTAAVTVNVSASLSPFSISASPNPPPPVNLPPGRTQDIFINISTADGLLQDVAIGVKTTTGAPWLKSPLVGIQAPGQAKITVDTTGLGSGTYSGTVTFSCALTSGADAPCASVEIPVALNVSSAPPSNTPTIRAAISASAFGGFSTIAPGSYIEIYGSNLSTTDPGRTWAGADFTNNGTNAPTSLDGTTVRIGGQLAFVFYVSPGQINALVPSNAGTGPSTISVTSPTGTTAPYAITINSVQPGLLADPAFRVGAKQYVEALIDPRTLTFALPAGAIPGVPSRPAKPGETVLIYGVGFGPVSPQINAGTVVSNSNSLIMPLQISFGDTPAQLAYFGLAPSFTGLYQFNVIVPEIPDNDAVPLKFNLGGVDGTQTLYIAVHH